MGMLGTHDGTIVSAVRTQNLQLDLFWSALLKLFSYNKYREKRIPCFKHSVALTTVLHSVL